LSQIKGRNIKCLGLFIDLKKAFNSICPLELFRKLFELVIDSLILKYLCAYFLDRTFRIKLGDFPSMLCGLVKGCPQGGILSPLLFSIYYNEVGSALLSAKFKLFADDLVFYIFNANARGYIKDAEKILAALNSWCLTQDLVINFSKTQYIIFHKAQNKLEDDLTQIICGVEIIE